MNINEKIDHYLNESNDLPGHVNGAIGWLELIKREANRGNYKIAYEVYQNLMKNLKLMEPLLKPKRQEPTMNQKVAQTMGLPPMRR